MVLERILSHSLGVYLLVFYLLTHLSWVVDNSRIIQQSLWPNCHQYMQRSRFTDVWIPVHRGPLRHNTLVSTLHSFISYTLLSPRVPNQVKLSFSSVITYYMDLSSNSGLTSPSPLFNLKYGYYYLRFLVKTHYSRPVLLSKPRRITDKSRPSHIPFGQIVNPFL